MSSALWGIRELPGVQIFHHHPLQEDTYRGFNWSGWVVDMEMDEMPWVADTHSPSYLVARALAGQQFPTRRAALDVIQLILEESEES
jgi:hypothetical protein